MVTEYGMSNKLGPLSLGKRHGPVFLGRDLVESRNYSEEIAYEIDKEIRRIIDECYERARAAIGEHREALDRIAKALLEHESLEADELERLFRGETTSPAPEPPAPEPPSAKPELAVPETRGRVEGPIPQLRPKPEASA
jgi:cell division protease FtsH